MKLEYKILWIENEEDFVDSFIPSVESFLIERGFEPIISKVIDEALVDDFLDTNYDLIISDFNLNEKNGDVVIYELRNTKKLSTEILFYSSKTNFLESSQIREKLSFMERINIQYGRESLLDKIEKVIELTLGKLLELNATRGLITAATSDLDVEIEELVMFLIYDLLKLDENKIDKIIHHYIDDFLKKSPERFLKKYNEVGFKDWFHKIEAGRKWQIFRSLLKEVESHEIKEFLDINANYGKDVIEVRNTFAHAKAILNDQGFPALKAQLGKEDLEYTNQKCIEIRRVIIEHKKSIEKLKTILIES